MRGCVRPRAFPLSDVACPLNRTGGRSRFLDRSKSLLLHRQTFGLPRKQPTFEKSNGGTPRRKPLAQILCSISGSTVKNRLTLEHVELREARLDLLQRHVHGSRKTSACEGCCVARVDGNDGAAGEQLRELGWFECSCRPGKKGVDELTHLGLPNGADRCVLDAPFR